MGYNDKKYLSVIFFFIFLWCSQTLISALIGIKSACYVSIWQEAKNPTIIYFPNA